MFQVGFFVTGMIASTGQKVMCLEKDEMRREKFLATYRWFVGIIWRKAYVEEEEAVVVRSSRCANNRSSHQIHPFLVNSDVNCLCPIQKSNRMSAANDRKVKPSVSFQ